MPFDFEGKETSRMFPQNNTSKSRTGRLAAALAVAGLAMLFSTASLAMVIPQSVDLSTLSTATDTIGQPLRPVQIFLYDAYGEPINVSMTYSYVQGHILDHYGNVVGTVDVTGHILDDLGSVIGFVNADL